MFSLAILIGIYSYIIFSLGLLRFLYPSIILLTSLLYLFLILSFKKGELMKWFKCFKTFKKVQLSEITAKNKTIYVFLIMLFLQAMVNLVGVFGPELSFDTLWYHLTLPKIYLINHQISFIPGGLLYYSAMPQLTEMLYTASLAFSSEILAKIMHFSFGILSLIALYKFSRKFFDQKFALLVVVVFYGNLVVGWESIAAYVDLARTFFEIMALWGFVNWLEKNERKWLVESAVMLGLAISTKLLGFGSLFIFSVLIIYFGFLKKKSLKISFANVLIYWCVSILVVLPWLVFSLLNTGNPVYLFFSKINLAPFNINLINPINFLSDTWILFVRSSDPISPLYLIFFPLIVFYFKKLKIELKFIAIYSFLALIVWYLTPRTGGGRFILPYLPAFSLLMAATVRGIGGIWGIRTQFISLVIFISVVSIFYRGFANKKYLPVILGQQTKEHFLTNNLNFSFGDFYDTDSYFKNKINSTDRVLLYGFHNLYYINFPFIDSSWVKKGDRFSYIATQNAELPNRFKYWKLTYANKTTGVKLYSIGVQEWIY